MKWGLFGFFFSLSLGMSTYAYADSSHQELFSDAQMNLILRDGTPVQLYFPEKNQTMQDWVDNQTTFLLSTEIGLALCHQVFSANVLALQSYLAVSNGAANQMAMSCAHYPKAHPYVDNFKVSGPIKSTKSVAFEKRHYQFLLTENNLWPFDSWTDAATNQTVIIAQKSQSRDSLVFFQAMAHEFAIYFDGQYSVGTRDWWAIHEYENFKIISPDTKRLFIAVNNPVIAAILSYMRAFRVEQLMFAEINSRTSAPIDFGIMSFPTLYSNPAFRFLDDKCDHNCLMNFVKAQSLALSPYALAMTAYSGRYKDEKIKALMQASPSQGDLLKFAVEILNAQAEKHPKYSMLPFIALMETWVPQQWVSPIQEMFNNTILPEDLGYLDQARVQLLDTGETVSFLQWILKPVLSGRNVDFSSGPRPRIRTGGGGYGN